MEEVAAIHARILRQNSGLVKGSTGYLGGEFHLNLSGNVSLTLRWKSGIDDTSMYKNDR
jgi:hypothetical protein